jgi:hypothetical protein
VLIALHLIPPGSDGLTRRSAQKHRKLAIARTGKRSDDSVHDRDLAIVAFQKPARNVIGDQDCAKDATVRKPVSRR